MSFPPNNKIWGFHFVDFFHSISFFSVGLCLSYCTKDQYLLDLCEKHRREILGRVPQPSLVSLVNVLKQDADVKVAFCDYRLERLGGQKGFIE
jgi:hypothetical protein